ncbi:MAG: hypothetical protein ACPGVK_02880 [Halocynthiibacter sp.]
MDPSWNNIKLPGHLRNQFREQFEQLASDHLLPVDDQHSEVTVPDIFKAFDLADKHIGLHWPFLAPNLWKYGSHILFSAYFETSGTIADAMRGLLSTSTALYPVFSATPEMTPTGLLMRSRPTYPMDPRHWEIFQTLSLLTQTAMLKKFAPDETKGMVYNFVAPENAFSETLRGVATCKVNFGVPLEGLYHEYPLELLQKKISHKQIALNKVLYAELERQTALPIPEDNLFNDLNKGIYARFPELMPAEDAAQFLKMSRSTFQRMLKRRGVRYTDILNALRREYILIYLSKADPGGGHHIALGFKTPRALRDYCRTHFGAPLTKLLS